MRPPIDPAANPQSEFTPLRKFRHVHLDADRRAPFDTGIRTAEDERAAAFSEHEWRGQRMLAGALVGAAIVLFLNLLGIGSF